MTPSGVHIAVFVQIIHFFAFTHHVACKRSVFLEIIALVIDGLPSGRFLAVFIQIVNGAVLQFQELVGQRIAVLSIQMIVIPSAQHLAVFLKQVGHTVDLCFADGHLSALIEIIFRAVDLLPSELHICFIVEVVCSFVQLQPSDGLFARCFKNVISVAAFAMPSRLCFKGVYSRNHWHACCETECDSDLLAVFL